MWDPTLTPHGAVLELQERGRILVDVINYLESPGDEGEEGEEGEGGAADEPYPGKEGLEQLWNEVVDLCAEEDVPRLEEEVKDKTPEEQWKILLDVRTFLLEVSTAATAPRLPQSPPTLRSPPTPLSALAGRRGGAGGLRRVAAHAR